MRFILKDIKEKEKEKIFSIIVRNYKLSMKWLCQWGLRGDEDEVYLRRGNKLPLNQRMLKLQMCEASKMVQTCKNYEFVVTSFHFLFHKDWIPWYLSYAT